jgi:hypothetical protein
VVGTSDEAWSWADKAARGEPRFLPAIRIAAASSARAKRTRWRDRVTNAARREPTRTGRQHPIQALLKCRIPKTTRKAPSGDRFARDQWHCRICGGRFLYSEMVRKHIANEHNETMPPSMYEYFQGAVWQRKKASMDLALNAARTNVSAVRHKI